MVRPPSMIFFDVPHAVHEPESSLALYSFAPDACIVTVKSEVLVQVAPFNPMVLVITGATEDLMLSIVVFMVFISVRASFDLSLASLARVAADLPSVGSQVLVAALVALA